MTSEVCLMNRHAVVLAADSATTVSTWTPDGRETRYFKGANKILQLSDSKPVGLMIFDSAEILSVPWEVVVKAFRAELGAKSFNDVDGYANEFFSFLEGDGRLFPPDVQKEELVRAAKLAGFQMALTIKHDEEIPRDAWSAAFDQSILDQRAAIDARPLPSQITHDLAVTTVAAALGDATEDLDELLDAEEPRPNDLAALSELCLWSVLKQSEAYLSTTGMVFAGYGDHDIFPSHVHYVSSGIVAGRHIVREEGRQAITHATAANLSAFAQKSMIDTFQLGLDESVYMDAMLCVDRALREFAEKVIAASGGDPTNVADLGLMRDETRKAIGNDWLGQARVKHAYPLRRVLAALPINEMAELAETLVNLQSLKEKVTKPSEEVGGPIDVAVITKSEGLIWVRRKHYFEPKLNARYMARLGR